MENQQKLIKPSLTYRKIPVIPIRCFVYLYSSDPSSYYNDYEVITSSGNVRYFRRCSYEHNPCDYTDCLDDNFEMSYNKNEYLDGISSDERLISIIEYK